MWRTTRAPGERMEFSKRKERVLQKQRDTSAFWSDETTAATTAHYISYLADKEVHSGGENVFSKLKS